MTNVSNRISIRSGTYGDKHDPYSWEEVTMVCRAGKVRIHYGLDHWIELDGRRIETRQPFAEFTRLTGLTVTQAEEIYHR